MVKHQMWLTIKYRTYFMYKKAPLAKLSISDFPSYPQTGNNDTFVKILILFGTGCT